MFNRNGLTDEENDMKSLSGVVDTRVYEEPKSMKHSELVLEVNARVLPNEKLMIKRMIKSSTSGMNYLSLKFDTEEELDIVIQRFPGAHKCEKRYGFGFLVNQYTLKGNSNVLLITDSYKMSHSSK